MGDRADDEREDGAVRCGAVPSHTPLRDSQQPRREERGGATFAAEAGRADVIVGRGA